MWRDCREKVCWSVLLIRELIIAIRILSATMEDFDQALRMPEESRREIVAVDDRVLGHGTAVAGVAAGNGRGSVGRRNRGIAAESDLIIVKLAGRDDGFPRTTEVMN